MTFPDDGSKQTARPPLCPREVGWGVAATVALALAIFGGGMACGGSDSASQYNRSPSITSIGPLRFDGTHLRVEYTLRDPEGDDQSVYVGVCEGDDNSSEGLCPAPVEGAPSDGRSSLPTVPKGEDVSHQFAWNVGCGRIGSGTCRPTDLDQNYVVRIRLEGTDQTVASESFSFAESFGVEEVPECDESAGSVPKPCPPNAGSSS